MPTALLPQLTLEHVILAAAQGDFSFEGVDSYLMSYDAFLRYFQPKAGKLTRDDLIIGIHMAYGWMPTIFEFKHDRLDEAVALLNSKNIDLAELELLKQLLSNSIVGTSKLLHFIYPADFAIWDSRVYRFVTGNKPINHAKINRTSIYMDYLQAARQISKERRFKREAYEPLIARLGSTVTPLRALELILYISGAPQKGLGR